MVGRCALVIAGVLVMALGPALGSAAAATFFFSLNDRQAALDMAVSGSRVTFVPEHKEPFICSTCGEPNTPLNLQWANGRTNESGLVVIVSRATDQCVDIPTTAVKAAGKDVKKLAGTALVLAKCDNSDTQKFRFSLASGGSNTYVNKWSGLLLTNNNGVAKLFAGGGIRNATGTQTFGSSRTGVE